MWYCLLSLLERNRCLHHLNSMTDTELQGHHQLLSLEYSSSLTWFSFHCSQHTYFSVPLPILFSSPTMFLRSLSNCFSSLVFFLRSLSIFFASFFFSASTFFNLSVISNTYSFSIQSRLAFTCGSWYGAW